MEIDTSAPAPAGPARTAGPAWHAGPPGPCATPGGAPPDPGRSATGPAGERCRRPRDAPLPAGPRAAAETAVTAIYQAQALNLIRMAALVLGDQQAAEDVVQESFAGLYRRWGRLSDPGNALRYLRSSVLNGCRSALRRRRVHRTTPSADPSPAAADPAISAEAAVLGAEERQRVMAAVRRLPPRQREALVLRFYLDLPEQEIAATMGIGQSTVRSATHRAVASLARMLQEES